MERHGAMSLELPSNTEVACMLLIPPRLPWGHALVSPKPNNLSFQSEH